MPRPTKKTRRDADPPSPLHWQRLPKEIQDMIFGQVVTDALHHPEQHVLAKCAGVSPAWRCFFESYTFRSLVVSQACLPRLRDIVRPDRRHLQIIQVLLLRVRLEEYDCSACQTEEDKDTIQRNCVTFTHAVFDLLEILSSAWVPGRAFTHGDEHEWPQHGLQLGIDIYSPSDYKHVFRPFSLQEDYPYLRSDLPMSSTYEPLLRRAAEEQAIHDPPHGWINGAHTIPNSNARNRLYGTELLEFDFSALGDKRLPKSPIVRSLTVRRGTFRGFSANVLFEMLHKSLTRIQDLRIEKWQELDAHEQLKYDHTLSTLLRTQGLPKSLKNISFVRDNDSVAAHSVTDVGLSVGINISDASHHLETLSVAYIADARTFLWQFHTVPRNGYESTEQWESLRSLTLTTMAFRQAVPAKEGKLVIEAACRAAKLMPKLEDLSLWHCGKGEVAVFSYLKAKGDMTAPEITWKSSWPSQIATRAGSHFDNWTELARERDPERRDPKVVRQLIYESQGLLNSRLGFFMRLIPADVLDPATEREVKWECLHKSNPEYFQTASDQEDSI